MTERQGPTVPMKLTGSVTVSAKEVTPDGDSVARLVRKALDHADLVDMVMVLAKVNQEQAEHLVGSGTWEGYMHQIRIDTFRYFQAKERDLQG